MTTRDDLESMLLETRYALRQLREFRDHARAADAVERIEQSLDLLLAEEDAEDALADECPSARDLEEMHALADAYRADLDDDLPF